jgi:glycosyltransferase involved in cell wall biosynthesis
MKSRRIVFWQETPSPHQVPWIRALASLLPDGEVIGVFQRELRQHRLAMGWSPPDCGQTQVFMAPDRATMDQLIYDDCERTVHVFSGMVYNSALDAAFKQTLSTRAIVGILSEGRHTRGWKGVLRMAHSLFHEHRYRQRVDFVLAIGRVGMRWFTKCGYDPAKLFPFCYVVEKHPCEDDQNHINGPVTIVSVGRLIPLKRVDLLLKALAKVSTPEWRLKIIGEGEQRPSLESMAAHLGLKEKVAFMGGMSNRQVRQELDTADILVFTSREDGWGTVVNEALMSGVPVICSDYPGAADLVRPFLNGELFQCDSMPSLIQVLHKWVSKGPLTVSERKRIQGWSRCIEEEAVARYFMQIINYLRDSFLERPKGPWL